MVPFRLAPFSASPLPLDVTGHIRRTASGLQVRYRVQGDLAGLVLPAPAARPTRRDELWRTTCFELFAAPEQEQRYLEVNVSPSGDWNAYSFDRYRSGMAPAPVAGPRVSIHRAGSFDLTLELDLPNRPLSIGISAVLLLAGGTTTYWALTHPSERPDFHCRESFILRS